MDGWIEQDGWIYGWMDKWMEWIEWMDGQMEG